MTNESKYDELEKNFQELQERFNKLSEENSALKSQNKSFACILDTVHDGFFILGNDLSVTFWNKKAEELLGLKKADVLGRKLFDIFPEAIGTVWEEKYTLAIKEKKAVSFETYVRLKPYENWYKVQVNTQEDGIAVHFIITTERHKTEEILKESEEKFKLIFENAMDGIYIVDVENRKTYAANQVFCDMLGYTQDELKNIGVKDIHQQSDFPRVNESFEKMLRGEESLVYNIPVKRKDGSVFYADINGSFVKLHGITYALGIFRDMTERRNAEEAIRESEAKFRAITESARDAIFCKNTARKYTFLNPAGEKLVGLPASEFIGKTPEEIFSPEDCATIAEVDSRNLAGEIVDAIRTITINGIEHILHVIQVPLRDGKGNINGISGIIRDITENKKLEMQLQQAQKMESIGRLAGGVAHDINNILTSMIGFAGLLKDSVPMSSTGMEYLDEIMKSSKRMKDIVSQILTFSRQTKPKMIIVKLDDIVKEVMNFLRASIPSTVEIIQNISPTLGAIHADPSQINQLLINLCTNAVQAIEGNGVIEISLNKVHLGSTDIKDNPDLSPGEYAELTVKDTGKGIDKKILPHIFEPFFTTKSTEKNTGLGLALVLGIVKSHGGIIQVDSKPCQGTTFHIFFPSVEGEPLPQDLKSVTPVVRGHENILFVDDEVSIVKLMNKMLGAVGYRVTSTTSSIEALEIFQSNPGEFDLVIMDQTMPKLTGIELAKKFLQIMPELPIILCSGYSPDVSQEIAKNVGVREFLMKPVDREEMLGTIRKVLDKV